MASVASRPEGAPSQPLPPPDRPVRTAYEVIARMAARSLCILALLAVLVLSGCSGGGGGSAPELLAGNYFPLVVGTVWTFDTVLQAETQTDSFETTGTMTRTVTGIENITVDGVLSPCTVIQNDYTTAGVPAFGGASAAVAPFINHCFAADGGLNSVRSFYRVVAATADFPAHIELVAQQRVGDAIVIVPRPRPYLFSPTYHGTMSAARLWFVPMPLMPDQTELSSVEEHEKTLNYDFSDGLGGPANCVVSIYYYGANLTVDGNVAAIAGRGRNFYKDGVGLWAYDIQSDWYGTINVAGVTSRVTSRLYMTSFTPGP